MRQPSNKKPGGQVGHKGSTLKMVDIIVKYTPEVCQGCDENLKDVEGETVIQRQVFDLPTLKLQVTEHQVQIKVCPKCDYENEVQFPQHVTQPTQYGLHLTSVLFYLNYYQSIPYHHLKQLIKDIFRANISQGTLANMIKRLYDVLEPIQIAIKENLLSSNYLHLDETGCYVNRKRHWLHFTSNKKYTHYFVHEKHGSKFIEADGILLSFKGTVIHNYWTRYFKYEDCTHGLCNVHHLREFKGMIDFENQQWTKDMSELLLEAKTYSEDTDYPLPLDKVQEFGQRYQKIIEEDYLANPLKAHEKNTYPVRF